MSIINPRVVPVAPVPEQMTDHRMRALKMYFEKLSDIRVWRHCLGLQLLPDMPRVCRDLANHVLVICIDCEHWSENTDELTEIGLATLSRQDMLPILRSEDLGDHGENLMKRGQFQFLRIIENSHLPWNTEITSKGNPDSNRFGVARFVTFEQARSIIEKLFFQRLTHVKGLENCYRPVIVMGHDVGHDIRNMKRKISTRAVNLDSCTTIVRYLDGQVLARDVQYPRKLRAKEKIGLPNLVKSLHFEHSDPHTAANDASRTLMCAVQLALLGYSCKTHTSKTMQKVATDLEQYSRENFQPLGGEAMYCWRCGSHDHTGSHVDPVAACTLPPNYVCCSKCWNAGYQDEAHTHINAHCLRQARIASKARRDRHAREKADKELRKQDQRRSEAERNDLSNHAPWMPPQYSPHQGNLRFQQRDYYGQVGCSLRPDSPFQNSHSHPTRLQGHIDQSPLYSDQDHSHDNQTSTSYRRTTSAFVPFQPPYCRPFFRGTSHGSDHDNASATRGCDMPHSTPYSERHGGFNNYRYDNHGGGCGGSNRRGRSRWQE